MWLMYASLMSLWIRDNGPVRSRLLILTLAVEMGAAQHYNGKLHLECSYTGYRGIRFFLGRWMTLGAAR